MPKRISAATTLVVRTASVFSNFGRGEKTGVPKLMDSRCRDPMSYLLTSSLQFQSILQQLIDLLSRYKSPSSNLYPLQFSLAEPVV